MPRKIVPYVICGTKIKGFTCPTLIDDIRKARNMEEKDYPEDFVKWFSKFLGDFRAPLSLSDDYNWLWRKMMIEKYGRENVKFHDEM